jgi:hypothetical protein
MGTPAVSFSFYTAAESKAPFFSLITTRLRSKRIALTLHDVCKKLIRPPLRSFQKNWTNIHSPLRLRCCLYLQ